MYQPLYSTCHTEFPLSSVVVRPSYITGVGAPTRPQMPTAPMQQGQMQQGQMQQGQMQQGQMQQGQMQQGQMPPQQYMTGQGTMPPSTPDPKTEYDQLMCPCGCDMEFCPTLPRGQKQLAGIMCFLMLVILGLGGWIAWPIVFE